MITIPKTEDLYNDIIADLEAEFPITIPIIGRSFLRVFAGIQAANLKLFYISLGKVQKNIFIDTADREASGGTLERFGRVKLGRDPFPATQGQYTITVTGTTGATIPGQTTFKSNDDAQNPGKLFILDSAHTLVASTDTITVRALESGLTSRLNIGEELTATAPIISVNSNAAVATETIIPQAAEDIEEYRAKGIESYRLEPQGGAFTDYRLWGLDAQGVKQIYPYAKSGAPNEINVFVEATTIDSTDGHGTPTTAILNEVDACIEEDPDTSLPSSQRGRRPVTVWDVHVLPVSVLPVDITIHGYVDSTVAKQTLIHDTIEEALAEVRPFIGGADILSEKNDTISNNTIIGLILTAVPGSVFGAIDLSVNSIAVLSYVFDQGKIPFLNSITYA